ncbi:hypothetical protein DBV05_g10615 [Lasiodiplodia theobromae]|uniref:3-beta hydroxysteroid dehydrogenase/isomerase domain-containing protein n=1 Tax=Lasiodiplodia theobromae TaxID=45133 RepID=A0A5N5CZA7_9PEZI|nr:hypothetical protein DBV05_g10615 [Lasiodiplodia theobromae]
MRDRGDSFFPISFRFQLGQGTNLWDFCYIDNFVHGFFPAASALLRAADAPNFPSDRRVEGEAIKITNIERLPFWGFTRVFEERFSST